MPKETSFAFINRSFWNGAEPLSLKSFKVKVKEGKCLKNDNSDSLKFYSPSRFLLANIFTFSVMVSAKTMGNITSSNNEIIKVIPVTFRILRSNVFFEFSIFIVVERLGKITTKIGEVI